MFCSARTPRTAPQHRRAPTVLILQSHPKARLKMRTRAHMCRKMHTPTSILLLRFMFTLLPQFRGNAPLLMLAVVLLTLQGMAINRLAGLDYPLWEPRPERARSGGSGAEADE